MESYEICEYESLIDMARDMEHSKVAQLLKQNLKEEKETLRKMEAFSKRVKPKEMMSEEQNRKPLPPKVRVAGSGPRR